MQVPVQNVVQCRYFASKTSYKIINMTYGQYNDFVGDKQFLKSKT